MRRRRRWRRWFVAAVVVGVAWLIVANIRWPDRGPVQSVAASSQRPQRRRRRRIITRSP